jgi:hypothetical protein
METLKANWIWFALAGVAVWWFFLRKDCDCHK